MQYNIKNLFDNTVPRQVNDFLNYLGTIRGKSENTIYNYKIDLTLFFRFLKLYKGQVNKNADFNEIFIGDIDDEFIKNISLSDLYAFISFTENFRNNSNYARARKVATLKSFFKYLSSKAKILKENPTLELESPKIHSRNPIYLSLEQSKELLYAVKGEKYEKRDYCILILFLNCGMRLSELVGINISKIKNDTLSIIGKGNKERTVYLNNICIKAIENYMSIRNEQLEKVSREDKDALFLSRNNKRISKRTVEITVKKYIKKANLDSDKYTPHKLRHTAATLMYKYGDVDIRSLQQILGHESVSTTQIYTHVDNEKLREAVKSNPLNDLDD
ncbi:MULTISPECIES: tyrosine recombinase XerC [Clostridium]|jgi:site-specific recombinase XerD|uniref:tyrosine recombinase XerC n=1 Tax=Clostridium TaxID=1485 RepID=UPI000288FC00|nr:MULTISPECIES: tyrosine recombinase XerC [Clostridium]MDF2502871.1 site-specific recombinase XerD [Clostridium sp.]